MVIWVLFASTQVRSRYTAVAVLLSFLLMLILMDTRLGDEWDSNNL